MEIVFVVSIIIALLILYFFFGILVKFLWGWLPLIIGGIIGLGLGVAGGTISAIVAIIIFITSLILTNNWQGSDLYFNIEEKIDSMFYFKD
ncbi:MAG: hypothetical protein L3J19_00710 [Sulfurimonas sp.]|nr:hypothetical protein [Sulfurimonas sp.]